MTKPGMRRKCSVRGCGKPHVAKGLCTRHYANMRIHGQLEAPFEHKGRKVTADQVAEIRTLAKENYSAGALAEKYGLARSTVGQIIRGEVWRGVLPGGEHERRRGRAEMIERRREAEIRPIVEKIIREVLAELKLVN